MRWTEQHGDGSTKPFSKRPANAERKPEHGGSAILKNAGRYFSLRGTVKAIWSPSGRSGFPMCPAKCTLPTKFCPTNSLVVTFETASSVRPRASGHQVNVLGRTRSGAVPLVASGSIKGNKRRLWFVQDATTIRSSNTSLSRCNASFLQQELKRHCYLARRVS